MILALQHKVFRLLIVDWACMSNKGIMNPYQNHIKDFFQRNIELQHSMYEISETIEKSMNLFESCNNWDLKSFSQLVISDWSVKSDNGWVINNSTGNSKTIRKENHQEELRRIISAECCYTFAQTYESLERFIKDCIVTRTKTDVRYKEYLEKKYKKVFCRDILRGSSDIFDCIKKAGNPYFNKISNSNNSTIKFKEYWDIISQVRHGIIHSSSKIEIVKIHKTPYHFKLFDRLFSYKNINDEVLEIQLDYKKTKNLQKIISEFGFQIFKSISMAEGLDWDILIKHDG